MTNTKAALILPDIRMRSQFIALLEAGLEGLDLKVLDPLDANSPRESISDTEVILTFGHLLSDRCLAQANHLAWVQSLGAGVDGILDRPDLRPEVLITNARGMHGAAVPETAICLMLAIARGVPGLVRAQAEHRWVVSPSNLLFRKTVGILGVGAISEALAVRCRAFGMRVEGVTARRTAPGFDCLWPYSDLPQAIAGFDYLVLLAPFNEENAHIINADMLALMKPGAVLINVARGGIVDEAALIAGLRAGRPAAAGLDVFEIEPLDRANPLWDLPNVIVSPHGAGHHNDYAADLFPVIAANWEAFRAGRPAELVNVVRSAARRDA